MKLAGSLEKARAIGPGQHKAAAGLYNDIEQELEHGGYSEEESEEADQALAHLEEHHAGVRQAAHQIERPPSLSRRAKRNLDEPERTPVRAMPKEQHQRQRQQPGRTVRQRVALATAVHATRRRRGSGRGFSPSAAFGQIPGSGTVSQLLLRTLGGVAGISLTYLLLTPKGSSAISTASNGITDVLRVLADPTKDPLNPHAVPSVPQGQGRAVFQTPSGPVFGDTFDTPTGRAPFKPPTNLPGSHGSGVGATPGQFDTPGGIAVFKPPTRLPKIVRK